MSRTKSGRQAGGDSLGKGCQKEEECQVLHKRTEDGEEGVQAHGEV